MELQTFKRSDFLTCKNPLVYITANGSITFNSRVVLGIGLIEGDLIEFAVNKKNEKEWFFRKTQDLGAFILRKKSIKGRNINLWLNCKGFTSLVLSTAQFTRIYGEVSDKPNKEGWYKITPYGTFDYKYTEENE